MPSPTALGAISLEWFNVRIATFHALTVDNIGLVSGPDLMSLVASGSLQNAIKYCTKVRKTVPASKESNNSATV